MNKVLSILAVALCMAANVGAHQFQTTNNPR